MSSRKYQILAKICREIGNQKLEIGKLYRKDKFYMKRLTCALNDKKNNNQSTQRTEVTDFINNSLNIFYNLIFL